MPNDAIAECFHTAEAENSMPDSKNNAKLPSKMFYSSVSLKFYT